MRTRRPRTSVAISRAAAGMRGWTAKLGKASRMSTLPQPRGPLSEALFDDLRMAPHDLSGLPGTLEPEDLHLALYCCYELHYRGFDGVDDRWEWEPSLLRLRAE